MKDMHAVITDRFIEQLKQGTVPWQKPWGGVQNIVSQKQYRGINSLMLGSSEFASPYWMSFKQASDLGGRVKKGEKSTPVVYYKFLEKRDDAGNVMYQANGMPARIPLLRWSNVFNLQQTDGIEPPKQVEKLGEFQSCERAAEIIANANICPIRHVGFSALYSPQKDEIRMPHPSTFNSQQEYYHTTFHEAVHSTGHQSRLDREGVTGRVRFGSERYSKEELIAELGAAFLSNEAGILDGVLFDNSAAYLNSWIQKLQSDHRLIVSAASMAQKSSDFIMGVELKESMTESHLSPDALQPEYARENGIEIPSAALKIAEGELPALSHSRERSDTQESIPRKRGIAL